MDIGEGALRDAQLSEVISIIQPGKVTQPWQPAVGLETLDLLDHLRLPETSQHIVLAEAQRVLSWCVPPNGVDQRVTGLVVGYVQSGKTMSFTTVAALARDNGYRMVIVITGISQPLLDQSTERLKRDLRLQSRPDRKWLHLPSPAGPLERRIIEDTLDEWRDVLVPEVERRTVLITVMKNHRHLDKLIALLSPLDLAGVPCLIIDDEADQAGLNTLVRKHDESATYRRLLRLRECLPHHSYLQYTATPQAPLLITLLDVLSPRFAEVLTPGPDYAGGKEFFQGQAPLVRTIPARDIIEPGQPVTEPPESLLEAMRAFYLGVAAGLVEDGGIGTRSMLVHPSQKTVGHRQYARWVENVAEHWKRTLELPDGDPDREDLLEEFKAAYADLKATVSDLPAFQTLARRLLHAVRRTMRHIVNAARGKTPSIDWSTAYGHILIGGQALDRGFTVEGLTVTYMPRGSGVGHADTIQQRARFFGYKRPYLGYCRVYLEPAVRFAFEQYVDHEESVRRKLLELSRSGRPLSEWKRSFLLDPALHPTRANVLLDDYVQGTFSDAWFAPGAPHDPLDALDENWAAVREFLGTLTLHDDEGNPQRTEMQIHQVARDVPLKRAFDQLLTRLRLARPDDAQRFTGLLLQVETWLADHSQETCTVFQMSSGHIRVRSTNEEDEVENLFQGRNPLRGPVIYPGDREIHANGEFTVQIYTLRILDKGSVVADEVPAVTVWVPKKMAAGWLVQDQGGQ